MPTWPLEETARQYNLAMAYHHLGNNDMAIR